MNAIHPGRELRFVALGDSVTVGVGDPTERGWRGWAALLAESLATSYSLHFANVASEGATASQVLRDQLPPAIHFQPHLASMVVGINDTLRSTFDPARIRGELFTIAGELTGATLLMLRFHDHGRVFGLPGFLRHRLSSRIEAVNAVYDEIHSVFGGLYVDLAARPQVYARTAWSVDRLHPSERGHRELARACAQTLEQAGLSIANPPGLDSCGGTTPSRWADLVWMATKATPWIGRRAWDLGPQAARSAVAATVSGVRRVPVGVGAPPEARVASADAGCPLDRRGLPSGVVGTPIGSKS
ncbi:SGNH/GDSL hydrolase family protein [Actinopolymorpha alba]|uniref:SGNH/GDSL hydrolase family protein n=1 Tax=Actinopolymorpha alba TaxID=533267 RepID=UPI0003617BEE|nr:SGNH/GDSL hydrolase family protein [Actinopolymorpha alba]